MNAYDYKLEDLQQERRQSQLLGQRMCAELSNELPPNEVNKHVDNTEGTEHNNNNETDLETESEPQRNIHRRRSPN